MKTALVILGLALLYTDLAAQEAHPVVQREISRYALTLFPFDSPDLGPMNERILREEVLPDVKKSSVITVIGYTDVVGQEPHNLELSRKRATRVASRIREGAGPGGFRSLVARGVGEESPLYANQLPEERFYNRTVVIDIVTEPYDER